MRHPEVTVESIILNKLLLLEGTLGAINATVIKTKTLVEVQADLIGMLSSEQKKTSEALTANRHDVAALKGFQSRLDVRISTLENVVHGRDYSDKSNQLHPHDWLKYLIYGVVAAVTAAAGWGIDKLPAP